MNPVVEEKINTLNELLAQRKEIDLKISKLFGLSESESQEEIPTINKGGRPKGKAKNETKVYGDHAPISPQIRKLLEEGLGVKEIVEKLSCSPQAVYIEKSKLRKEPQGLPPRKIPVTREFPRTLISDYGRTLVGNVNEAMKRGGTIEKIAEDLMERIESVEAIYNELREIE